MKYSHIKRGIFISRPNRFIANVEVDGTVKVCHVKNTGRCRELLIPGVTVILEHSDNPTRRTEYDLIAVYKGDTLINIDSQAPNKVFGEWISQSGFFKNATLIKPDAPTERGVKHVTELVEAKKNGYDTYIFFIIQMKKCKYFTPNRETHPEFADALTEAQKRGVGIFALTCNVTDDSLEIDDFVECVYET